MKENEYGGKRPDNGRSNSHTSRRKPKRRRRKLSKLAYALILITVAVIAAVICARFFLKVDNITVSGSDLYSRQQIEQASGIQKGSGLLEVNKNKIQQEICSKLPYIESTNVSIIFPKTVKITVKQADVKYVFAGATKEYIYADAHFKVLELRKDNKSARSVPVFTGAAIKAAEPGKELQFESNTGESDISGLLDAALSSGLKKITIIDIYDGNQIAMTYDNRIKIILGTAKNANEKLSNASVIIKSQLQATDKGSLDVSSLNKRFVFSPS